MPDGPEADQVAGGKAGLLAELAARGRLGRLAGFDLAARELPEPGQEPASGAALDEPAAAVGEHDHRPVDVGPFGVRASAREAPGVGELETGPAGERDRADPALRTHGPADGLAELHHGLVERTGVPRREDRSEGRLQPVAHAPVPHVAFLAGPAGDDPDSVRLEGDLGAAERDRRDGPRDVRPDAGESLELGGGRRETAPALPHDPSRGFVEVVRAGVVAGPLPELEDPPSRGPRERLEGRERREEPLEVGTRLGDPRLLEKDLGDPHPVGVPVPAPRKRSTMVAVPSKERGGERDRKSARRRRNGPHGRIVVPDERGA